MSIFKNVAPRCFISNNIYYYYQKFACHIETCPKLFTTPKNRRLHLIQTHGYPKEYFFAVTNKGVGGLLKKWGEGASLIRGSWKSRESSNSTDKMDIENDD